MFGNVRFGQFVAFVFYSSTTPSCNIGLPDSKAERACRVCSTRHLFHETLECRTLLSWHRHLEWECSNSCSTTSVGHSRCIRLVGSSNSTAKCQLFGTKSHICIRPRTRLRRRGPNVGRAMPGIRLRCDRNLCRGTRVTSSHHGNGCFAQWPWFTDFFAPPHGYCPRALGILPRTRCGRNDQLQYQ